MEYCSLIKQCYNCSCQNDPLVGINTSLKLFYQKPNINNFHEGGFIAGLLYLTALALAGCS